MKSLNKLQEKYLKDIDKEIARTEKEIKEFEQKQHDNESYYGCGGFYHVFEKAIERRQKHLHNLESLKKNSAGTILTDPVTVYSYYCPTCSTKVMLSASFGKDMVDCPVCHRTIFKSSDYERFDVVRGSRWCISNHTTILLESDGNKIKAQEGQ